MSVCTLVSHVGLNFKGTGVLGVEVSPGFPAQDGGYCHRGQAGGQGGGRGGSEAGSRRSDAAPPGARCSEASASASRVAGQPVSLATRDAEPGAGACGRP